MGKRGDPAAVGRGTCDVYLYKGAGKKSEISNYRPISLTSVIAKVFTKILQPRLEKVLHPGLSPFQGCGKKGSGAMEHLWAFMSTVNGAMQDTLVYPLRAEDAIYGIPRPNLLQGDRGGPRGCSRGFPEALSSFPGSPGSIDRA